MVIRGHFCYQQFFVFLVVVDFPKIAHHSSLKENLGSLQPESLRAAAGSVPALSRLWPLPWTAAVGVVLSVVSSCWGHLRTSLPQTGSSGASGFPPPTKESLTPALSGNWEQAAPKQATCLVSQPAKAPPIPSQGQGKLPLPSSVPS